MTYAMQVEEEGNRSSQLEDEFRSHKQSLEMLDDFDKNMKLLQEITAQSGERLVELAQEWEKHRQPMLQVYREHKQKLSQRKLECRTKLERIKTMRLEMKQMIQQLHEKDALTAKMKEEYEKMPKAASRGSYTVRILEIVKNVEKQKNRYQSHPPRYP